MAKRTLLTMFTTVLANVRVLHVNQAHQQCRCLTDSRTLEARIVTAWRERAFVLSANEQKKLQREVQRVCQLLTGLPQPDSA